MNRDTAYEVAVRMFQLEAERWAKNALGLAAVLVAIFAGYGQLKGALEHVNLCWPFFLSSVVSAAAVLIASSIRGTTDAWRATVRAIENSSETAELQPFVIFAEQIHRFRNRAPRDLGIIFFGLLTTKWRRRRLWIRRTLFSVTRLYTLLFGGGGVFFLIVGLWYAGFWHVVGAAFVAAISSLHTDSGPPPSAIRFIVPWLLIELREMRTCLKIASAICGVAAALFWFLSAHRTPTPPVGNYWDVSDGPNSPFARDWRQAARFNQVAAALTGLSIFLAAVAQL